MGFPWYFSWVFPYFWFSECCCPDFVSFKQFRRSADYLIPFADLKFLSVKTGHLTSTVTKVNLIYVHVGIYLINNRNGIYQLSISYLKDLRRKYFYITSKGTLNLNIFFYKMFQSFIAVINMLVDVQKMVELWWEKSLPNSNNLNYFFALSEATSTTCIP